MFPSTFVRYFPNAKEDKVLFIFMYWKVFFLLPHHFLEHLKHFNTYAVGMSMTSVFRIMLNFIRGSKNKA